MQYSMYGLALSALVAVDQNAGVLPAAVAAPGQHSQAARPAWIGAGHGSSTLAVASAQAREAKGVW